MFIYLFIYAAIDLIINLFIFNRHNFKFLMYEIPTVILLYRYQQKIGTYDKQKWETKIEQREQRIHGLNHIQTRSAKPNPDLIDLDLVRGIDIF